MKYAYIDTETVSDLDIKSAGTVRYAEECEALCVTIIPPNSNDCILWEAHRGPMPRNMRDLLDDDSITWVAHNALFDRTVMVNALGCANLDDPSRWVCTAALCRYMGLPGKLAQACTRLAVPPHLCKFDDSGGINLFTKRYSKRFYTPEQMPEQWRSFMDYAVQDTHACKAVHLALQRIAPAHVSTHWEDIEHDVFLWDQRINERGMRVDLDVLRSAEAIIERVHPMLEQQLSDLTHGEVSKLGSAKLKTYLATEFLMDVPNLQKDTVSGLLDDPMGMLDPTAAEILKLRKHGHKTSLAKYKRMDEMASRYDGRVRAAFLYGGAHTKRWSGAGFQPQNLTRPEEGLDPKDIANQLVAADGDPTILSLLYDESVFEVLASGIRGAIIPQGGCVFVIGDYNQIESRVTAHGAQCHRKLQAFADHDAGLSDLDPYEVTALDVLGDASKRQQGKMLDLGLGFGMGAPKFCGINKIPVDVGTPLVYAWRDTYTEVPTMWSAMAALFFDAIGRARPWARNPDEVDAHVRWLREQGVDVTRDHNKNCTLTLPSGNPIMYHGLRCATWGESMAVSAKFGRAPDARARFVRRFDREYRPDQDSKRWNESQLCYRGPYGNIKFVHGGLFTENYAQGTAREVMVRDGLALFQNHQLLPVLHSHDEMVFEVPKHEAEEARRIVERQMSAPVSWLPDMPMKADVQIHDRYTK
jgi:DNA polymerase I-like protein with 3'-5' exonuclease and polymerase domains